MQGEPIRPLAEDLCSGKELRIVSLLGEQGGNGRDFAWESLPKRHTH